MQRSSFPSSVQASLADFGQQFCYCILQPKGNLVCVGHMRAFFCNAVLVAKKNAVKTGGPWLGRKRIPSSSLGRCYW